MKRLKQAVVVLVVLLAAAQVIRPASTSATTDTRWSIQAAVGPTSPLPGVLDRSCADCHSNTRVSSWCARVAPLSWLMPRSEGRKAVNFSQWGEDPPDVQRTPLLASCDDATTGKMPGPYTLFRPEAKLSSRDVETICAAARQP